MYCVHNENSFSRTKDLLCEQGEKCISCKKPKASRTFFGTMQESVQTVEQEM